MNILFDHSLFMKILNKHIFIGISKIYKILNLKQ
jgi:hypothetical protein